MESPLKEADLQKLSLRSILILAAGALVRVWRLYKSPAEDDAVAERHRNAIWDVFKCARYLAEQNPVSPMWPPEFYQLEQPLKRATDAVQGQANSVKFTADVANYVYSAVQATLKKNADSVVELALNAISAALDAAGSESRIVKKGILKDYEYLARNQFPKIGDGIDYLEMLNNSPWPPLTEEPSWEHND